MFRVNVWMGKEGLLVDPPLAHWRTPTVRICWMIEWMRLRTKCSIWTGVRLSSVDIARKCSEWAPQSRALSVTNRGPHSCRVLCYPRSILPKLIPHHQRPFYHYCSLTLEYLNGIQGIQSRTRNHLSRTAKLPTAPSLKFQVACASHNSPKIA